MRCLNILDHKVFERCPPAGDGEGVQVEEQQAQVFSVPLFHGPLRRFFGELCPPASQAFLETRCAADIRQLA